KVPGRDPYGVGSQYRLQLKGLRKNFQTVEFARQLAQWRGHADFALEMTSKRMRHSTASVTARHYIEGLGELGLVQGQNALLRELVKPQRQSRIDDWD
ncbi:MAG: hypothetical protein LC687_06770, partial [Actinobacteria bacterium]|nr:hypothetical protein [Actinomycetota bacterium]